MGFSFASVILSYFLVAGGTFFTLLLAARLGIHSEYAGYLILAAGGFLGGVVAARASKGSTIVEPAIGAALVIVSFVVLALAVSSSEGRSVMLLPSGVKRILITAGAAAGGGVAGAFVSEKMFGDATTSSAPWLLYVSLAAFGATVMGLIFGSVLGKGEAGPIFGMLALFCALAGGAAGASMRVRSHLAAFFGGALGVGGFFILGVVLLQSLVGKAESRGASAEVPSEVYIGIVVLAILGGVTTVIGSAIGWASVGSKNAT